MVLSSFLKCCNSLPVPPLINELNIILDTCSFYVCVRIMATFSFSSESESPSVVSDSLWPDGLYSLIPGSRRSPGEGNGFPHFSGKEIPTPVFLPGEFHGQKSLVGYSQSMGLQRAGHDWSNLAPPHTQTLSHNTLDPLAVQWLKLHTSNAWGTGLIPGWGTKIPRAMRCCQKVKII